MHCYTAVYWHYDGTRVLVVFRYTIRKGVESEGIIMDTVLSICMDLRVQVAAIAQNQINFGDKLSKQEEAIDTINELTLTARETAVTLEMLKSRLGRIETKLETIEGRPIKHMQNVISQILSLVVAGAFGGATAKLFH